MQSTENSEEIISKLDKNAAEETNAMYADDAGRFKVI